jgi:hypothetical protein
MADFILSLPIAGRRCGPCTACCTIKGIPELAKEPYQNCQHLCAAGCSVYDQRPSSCREFECLWLQGHISGDERRRPDQLGLMFDVTGEDGAMGQVLVAWETRPGAADEPAAHYLLERMARRVLIIVRRTTKKMFAVGPEPLVRQFYTKAAEVVELPILGEWQR